MHRLTSIGLIFSFLTGCTTQLGNISFSGIEIARKGDESGTTTTITTDQQAKLHQEGNRILSEEEKKTLKKGFDEGVDFYKRQKRSSMIGTPRLYYVDTKAPFLNEHDKFLAKNPKAKGVEPDLILMGATAYEIFPHFKVFEGMRTLERQKELKKRGVSWTLKSKHLEGLAYDIIADDKRGKYSFKSIDRLGMARGVLFAAYVDLKEQGLMKCHVWEDVTLWKRIRDAYHIQLNKIKGCVDKVVYLIRGLHYARR